MQAASVLQRPIIPATALSFLFSLALFGLMYSVIHTTHKAMQAQETLPTIDFVRLKRDSEVETMSRRKPPPPPPQPPQQQKMRVATEAVQQEGMGGMALPELNLSAAVAGGPMGGKLGSGGGMFDAELIPLQRIEPTYPADARRAGITGWVQLEIVVNADGSVRSARVTASQPKGLFDAAAQLAVMRWKFRPKVQDGKPVEQKGSQRINFGINQPAAK